LNDEKSLHDNGLQIVIDKVNSNQYYEAINEADFLLKKFSCSSEIIFHKGLALHKLGYLIQAAEQYEWALRCNSIHTKSLLNLGSIYQKLHDFPKAIHKYSTGIKLLENYQQAIPGYLFINDDYIKMKTNLALAYFQELSLLEVSSFFAFSLFVDFL
jgi:tetratricopeptide (TPR) repeat protein